MSSEPAAASPGRPRPPVDVVRHAFERDHEIFFTAVETTRMPMTITDPHSPDNPIVFANRAFLEMTGYDLNEIVGHNCRFLQGVDTDPQTVSDVRQAIADGRQVAVELLNYRKNGSSFWNALFISPVYDTAGDLAYFFASQLDVSRRRDAEDALRQAQKMEAIGQLTGGIAHDFNNILQIITGYLDVLESGLGKPTIDVERQRRGLGNMRIAADRAATLTQQLLAFARKQKLQGRTLNLNAMLDGMDAMVARTIGDGTSLERRFAPDLWNCRIDPTQAELAVLNILINARDAMTGGDARIVVTTRNVLIDSTSGADKVPAPGRYVALEIADNGPGIPPDILERVMDPFFTTKEEGKGTGLGLSMVYGFAKQSGGAARIVSPPEGGALITLLFPATSDVIGAPGKAVRLVGRQGSETVLVVDDRRDIADLAADILDESGYRTFIAYGAAEALDLVARGEAIDLLFSDMIMPGTHSGVTLAREIRKRLPSIRVLLTTGYAEGSIEILDGGGQDFDVLSKPYKREDLLRKVRLVLDGPDGVS